MEIPPADLGYLSDRLGALADALLDAWDDSAQDTVPPPVLCDALSQLLTVLRDHDEAEGDSSDDDARLNGSELAEMIEYGIRLLSEAGKRAQRMGLADLAHDYEFLVLPLVLWGNRHGVEINRLQPVVNSLATLAERIREPRSMAQLVSTMEQVIAAVSPSIPQSDDEELLAPWRVLLLNRAIAATRTQQPKLMEPAFDAIVEWIPEEASDFFTEGMGQMDIIGYPEPVRALVQTYYLRYSGDRTLH